METELLALLVEVSSVASSGKQLKKPITVPRPAHVRRRGRGKSGQDDQGDAYRKGVAVLEATARGVRR